VLILVDGKNHVEGFDVVEKAFEAADLLFHALAQSGGDMDVLAADLDLHDASFLLRVPPCWRRVRNDGVPFLKPEIVGPWTSVRVPAL
jgi:hypothetical protein